MKQKLFSLFSFLSLSSTFGIVVESIPATARISELQINIARQAVLDSRQCWTLSSSGAKKQSFLFSKEPHSVQIGVASQSGITIVEKSTLAPLAWEKVVRYAENGEAIEAHLKHEGGKIVAGKITQVCNGGFGFEAPEEFNGMLTDWESERLLALQDFDGEDTVFVGASDPRSQSQSRPSTPSTPSRPSTPSTPPRSSTPSTSTNSQRPPVAVPIAHPVNPTTPNSQRPPVAVPIARPVNPTTPNNQQRPPVAVPIAHPVNPTTPNSQRPPVAVPIARPVNPTTPNSQRPPVAVPIAHPVNPATPNSQRPPVAIPIAHPVSPRPQPPANAPSISSGRAVAPATPVTTPVRYTSNPNLPRTSLANGGYSQRINGEEVRFRPDHTVEEVRHADGRGTSIYNRSGNLASYRDARSGTVTNYGSNGSHTILDRNGNVLDRQAILRTSGSRSGSNQSVRTVQRSTVINNTTVIRNYHVHDYGGYSYRTYVPRYYYSPTVYDYFYSPWAVHPAYRWWWIDEPWVTSYSYYYTPYRVYASPAYWLADFYVSSCLQLSYRTSPTVVVNVQSQAGPLLSDSIKDQISAQVEAVLRDHRQRTSTPLITNLQNGNYIFVVRDPIQVPVTNGTGQTCQLSGADIIRRYGSISPAEGVVEMLVVAAKEGNCRRGDHVMVSLEQLQEMQDAFIEQVDNGLSQYSSRKAPQVNRAPALQRQVTPINISTSVKSLGVFVNDSNGRLYGVNHLWVRRNARTGGISVWFEYDRWGFNNSREYHFHSEELGTLLTAFEASDIGTGDLYQLLQLILKKPGSELQEVHEPESVRQARTTTPVTNP